MSDVGGRAEIQIDKRKNCMKYNSRTCEIFLEADSGRFGKTEFENWNSERKINLKLTVPCHCLGKQKFTARMPGVCLP